MVILGLGSNLGNRLHNLRLALAEIKKIPTLKVIQVSPVYQSDALLPPNAPAHWNNTYLNAALRIETDLKPYALLTHIKKIEEKLGRVNEKMWGPRLMDIDILAWDDLIQYDHVLHIPHESLHERPFALWPLADVAPHWTYPLSGPFKGQHASEMVAQWGSRFKGEAPLRTQQIPHRIDTPAWVGILNVTPDSFSDGNHFRTPETLLKQFSDLVTAGAEIVDIGAESTRPNAAFLHEEAEWARLEPILRASIQLKSSFAIPPKISVDTYHVPVAERALSLGADWINDVSGLTNPLMRGLLAESNCDIVFMHHLGIPANPQKTLPFDHNPMTSIYDWANHQLDILESAHISRDRLIFDPGIGFGKTATQSLAILQQVKAFQTLSLRVLIGHSRKSFLNPITPHPPHERDIETAVISTFLTKQSVDFLRVHNVGVNARSVKIAKMMEGSFLE